MIIFLYGRVAEIGSGYVDLDVNHVGYRLHVTDTTALSLHEDAEVRLYTYQHVREDAILLFGFLRPLERTLFERLLSVSGVGPRVALQMLGAMQAEALIASVRAEDAATLCQLPGIGKKTAQRMILDLKDKLDDLALGLGLGLGPATTVSTVPVSADMKEDVTTALIALGYRQKEAAAAVEAVLAANPDRTVEQAVKAALQWLYEHQSEGTASAR